MGNEIQLASGGFFKALGNLRSAMSLVLIVLASFGSARILALDPSVRPTQYVHTIWKTDDGLPSGNVQAITQTLDGFLWIASTIGLVRFDGQQFALFDKKNTPELKANRILSLLADKKGRLWIGTMGGGLVCLEGGKFKTYTKRDGLPDDTIICLAEDSEGALWAGTRAGLGCFKDNRFRTFTASRDGLPRDRVQSLLAGRDGTLWIGTYGGGLAWRKNGKITACPGWRGRDTEIITSLLEDRTGALWVGTLGNGLVRMEGGRLTAFGSKEGLAGAEVLSIVEDDAASLWIGTFDQGLYRFRSGVVQSYTSKDGLSSDSVRSLFIDREGSLWIGTQVGGLNQLRDGKFVTYGKAEGLPSDAVTTVCQGPDGSIWFGTESDGIARLKDEKVTAITAKEGLSGNKVTAVLEDRRGDVWIALEQGGLDRLSGGKVTRYGLHQGLASERIGVLFQDRSGRLWIGTAGGLSLWMDGKFVTYTTQDGLPSNAILCLEDDPDGNLWVGTNGGGLARLSGGQFSTYGTQEGLSKNIVVSILFDREGCLWVATYDGGLSRMKAGRFITVTSKEGLWDDLIYAILEDEKGNLWMSSNRGVFSASRQELEDWAGGRRSTITCRPYGKADGMRSMDCNGGSQPVGWKAKNGDLWFPTAGGAVRINPNEIQLNEIAPPVVIDRVLVNNRPYTPGPGLAFPPGSRNFEFHYAGLSFVDSDKVQFKYRLEPLEKEWVDVGGRRAAYYTRLPPGNFRFRVIACNGDGVWNDEGASLTFQRKPHFYETYWFYLFCLLSTLALISGGHRIRVRQLKARERRLVKLVEERTRELRENQQKLLVSEKMASLGRLTAGIAHEMNTPLAAVRAAIAELKDLTDEYSRSVGNPEVTHADHREIALDMLKSIRLADSAAGRAAGFVRGIKSQTRDMAIKERKIFDAVPVINDALLLLSHALAKANCTVSFDPVADALITGSPGQLAQIVTNLVNNAIEASMGKGGGAIDLALQHTPEGLELTITDRGCGVSEEIRSKIFDPMFTTKPFGESTGLGLAIVHDLMVGQFEGEIAFSSEVGEGSTFRLLFPAPTGQEKQDDAEPEAIRPGSDLADS